MPKYIVRTQHQVFECETPEDLERKVNALTVLGLEFNVYELKK